MNNKNENGKAKALLASRRFQYGTVAVVFAVIVCAFLLLLNGVLSWVSNHNGGLFVDLTSEKIYDLSQNSIDVVDDVQKKLEIIFCVTEDKIEDSTELSYVKRLADKYSSINDNITIKCMDYLKDPVYFEQFKGNGNTITNTSVIVNCEENKSFVVYSLRNFFKFSSETGEIFAYDGENKLTSAIMQTALGKDKKAGFIVKHGETGHQYLADLLAVQGYDVYAVDLSGTSAEELADFDCLMICEPTTDYSGVEATKVGGVNEIEVLDTYLRKNMGNLMVFVSPSTPNLTELNGYLADTWGIGYAAGSVISEGSANTVSGNDAMLFYGTPVSDGGFGSKINEPVTSAGVDRTMFYYTVPLYMYKNEKTDISAVYTTSQNAVCTTDGTTVSAANTPIMALSKYMKMQNNVEISSNVLVCGSTSFLNFIDMSGGYANADIIKSTLAAMGDESVVTGIDYKVVEDSALEVSQDDFKAEVVKLTAIVPLIIAILGVIVYIKRKKS